MFPSIATCFDCTQLPRMSAHSQLIHEVHATSSLHTRPYFPQTAFVTNSYFRTDSKDCICVI